ncbi:MAG: hypothetical protein MUF29_00035 [Chitinophagaceae bacterium]|nr:hypothetical protein [Chitinophagaceae bacterium]
MCRPSKWLALLPAVLTAHLAQAQINSPYSRFALGDVYKTRNVVNKGMGGLATPYADLQSVNFVNPASYSALQTVTFDVGVEMELRTLLNPSRSERSQSTYLLFNYMAVGVPLAKDKKGMTKWGLALGIHPYSRVNYKILENERITGIDSANTIYEGSGGGYRAFLGTGYRIGGLSLGVNAGFFFGQMDVNTQRALRNDSVFYFNSQQETRTSFSNFAADGGLQYRLKLGKTTAARLGASGFLGNSVNATQDRLRQTFIYNASNAIDSVDVVERSTQNPGTIQMPAGYTVGLLFEKENKWLFGAEYEAVNWTEFSYYGITQTLANSSMLRVGGHFLPNVIDGKNYFSRVNYRAGFFTGKEHVVVNGTQLPVWGVSIGLGLPIRRYNVYSNQFTSVNTSLEFGRRGNANMPVTENFIRFNVGLSLSDIWFIKRRFD